MREKDRRRKNQNRKDSVTYGYIMFSSSFISFNFSKRAKETAEKISMMEELERLRAEVVSLKVLFIFYGYIICVTYFQAEVASLQVFPSATLEFYKM